MAFRKSAFTLQFEMKGLFCCEAHSVLNDLMLEKTFMFFRGIFPRCGELHNVFMFKVKPEWLEWEKKGLYSQPKQELR